MRVEVISWENPNEPQIDPDGVGAAIAHPADVVVEVEPQEKHWDS
jgi:hypothetical protein